MPSLFTFANNISTTLAGSISSAATSLTLSSAANLPSSIPAGKVLVITLNDVATRQQFEVIYATSISGATLSGLLRGQENTSAQAWSTGDYAWSGPTAGQQQAFGQLGTNNSWAGNNTFGNLVTANGGVLVPNNVSYEVSTTTGPAPALECNPSNQIQVGNASLPLFLLGAAGSNVFGVGQQRTTPALNYNQPYRNTTPAWILVACATSSTGVGSIGIYVDGFEFTNSSASTAGVALPVWSLVPPGSTYQFSTTGSVSGTASFVVYS